MKKYIVLRLYDDDIEKVINDMSEMGYRLFSINSVCHYYFAVTFEYDPDELTHDILKDDGLREKYRKYRPWDEDEKNEKNKFFGIF